MPFAPTDLSGLVLWLKGDTGTYQDAAKTTPATATSDPIGAWADQSGSANDMTQSTGANKGTLALSALNGKPGIVLSGNKGMLSALTTGALSMTDYTVFVVMQYATVTNNMVFGVGANSVLWFEGATSARLYPTEVAGAVTAANTPTILTMRYDHTTHVLLQEIYNDGVLTSTYGGSIDLTGHLNLAAFADLGIIGPNDETLFEVLAYSRPLTRAEQFQAVTYLCSAARWNLTAPTVTTQTVILFNGDSQTYGLGSSGTQGTATAGDTSYPARVMALLPNAASYRAVNGGIPGTTYAWDVPSPGANNQHLFEVPRLLIDDGYFDLGVPSGVHILWCGTNDLANAAAGTSTTLEARVRDYCLQRKAHSTGALKIIVLPVLDRTGDVSGGNYTTFTSERGIFNAWLAANYTTFADAFVDLNAITELTDSTNVTYFADGIHCTDAGYQKVAAAVEPVLAGLLVTPGAFQRNALQAGAFQVATTTLNKSLTGITIAPSMSVARHQTEPRHPTLTVNSSPSLVRHQTEPRHPSLSVSPSATLVRNKIAPRALSFSRTVTAALSRAGSTYRRAVSFSRAPSPSLARTQMAPRHPTLSISPSALLARLGTFRRTESLSITPGPLVVRSGSTFRRAVSLSVSPVLSLARRVSFPRATSFSISPTPIVARLGTWRRALSATVSISPTLARAAIHRRTAALSVAVSPTLARRGAFLRSLALAVTPSLSLSRAKSAPRTLTLTVGIAPSLTRRGVWRRAASLSVGITPSVTRHTTFRRALHASVSVSVSVARQGTFRRLLSFSVAPAETLVASVTHVGAITRDLALSISPVPIVQRIAVHARSQTASVVPTASVSRRLTSRRLLSFARAAAATLRRTATFRRAEAFTQSPSPTAQAATVHRRALSFATSPSPSVVRRQVLGRVLRVTRSVAVQVQRTGIWRRAAALSVPVTANVTRQRQQAGQASFSIPATLSLRRALTVSRRLTSSVAVSPSLSRAGSIFRRGVSTLIGWANRLIGFRYPYVRPPTIGVLATDGQTTGLLSADGLTVGVLTATGETTAEILATGRTTGMLTTAGISGTVFNPRLMAGVYVHGIQRAWNPGLLHAVNEIVQFVGVFQVVRDIDIPVSTDSSTSVTLLRDGLLSLYLTADATVTLTFQTSGSLTVGMLVLGADVPYAWTVEDDPLVSPCIITGDVATIHTNSAAEGTLRVRALMNG